MKNDEEERRRRRRQEEERRTRGSVAWSAVCERKKEEREREKKKKKKNKNEKKKHDCAMSRYGGYGWTRWDGKRACEVPAEARDSVEILWGGTAR